MVASRRSRRPRRGTALTCSAIPVHRLVNCARSPLMPAAAAASVHTSALTTALPWRHITITTIINNSIISTITLTRYHQAIRTTARRFTSECAAMIGTVRHSDVSRQRRSICIIIVKRQWLLCLSMSSACWRRAFTISQKASRTRAFVDCSASCIDASRVRRVAGAGAACVTMSREMQLPCARALRS